MTNPKQSQTLHVENLGDELSVYGWKRLQMHSLNPTAAQVFEMCGGQTSPAQMAAQLELDAPHAEALVWQSLGELENAHLLDGAVEKPAGHKNMTRRDFIPANFDADPVIPHPDALVTIIPAQFTNRLMAFLVEI